MRQGIVRRAISPLFGFALASLLRWARWAADEGGGLDGAEVALLLPDDRPRPHDAKPPHRLPRREAVRPHQVQRDERSGPA